MNTPVFIMCVLAAASAHLVAAYAGQRNYTSRASIVLGNDRERASAHVATTSPAQTCPTCPTCQTCQTCPTCPTLPPPTTCPPPPTCPTQPQTPPPMLPGYTRIPGVGCYKYHTAALLWSDAKVMCESEGGHLAVLNSQAEADAVKKLNVQNRAQITGTFYNDKFRTWLGVRESLTTRGDYYTIFGEPLNATGFTRWNPGYPSYTSSLGDVVALSDGSLLIDVMFFHDWKLPFACEQRRC